MARLVTVRIDVTASPTSEFAEPSTTERFDVSALPCFFFTSSWPPFISATCTLPITPMTGRMPSQASAICHEHAPASQRCMTLTAGHGLTRAHLSTDGRVVS